MHDTGLVTSPGPFRRLAGVVRHHQGQGEPWPDRVVLELAEAQLSVTDAEGATVGRWAVAEVSARRVHGGPPTTFVIQLPDAAHLLAAPAGTDVDALLEALSA